MTSLRTTYFLAAYLAFSCHALAQHSRMVTWAQVDSILKEKTDSITVMNFWATWCKPCVEELPHFEKTRKTMKDKAVRFIYISLDFAAEKSSRLDPFIRKKMPGAPVLLLDDTDYNRWIGKIDSQWSGSLPATLVYRNLQKNRIFADGEISETKLRSMIENVNSKTE